MEFPMEIINENFSGFTVESMETLETEEAGEVQYVYNNSEINTGGPDDFNNITDLVLEDGTRAMIVNGTLVTADGQTLILQDGSDLSQYSVDDNIDEIVISNLSKEQEDQFLQIMAPPIIEENHQNNIHYTHTDSNDVAIERENDQQILYIQDGENIIPIQEQYQIAELDTQDSNNEPMHVIQLGNNQILDEVGGIIDLEQLLLSQQGNMNLQDGNYQYAVLKDGKFHLQAINGSVNIVNAQEMDGQDVDIILGQPTEFNSADYLDLSAIKGRNIETGQVITLSRHMDRTVNQRMRATYKKGNSKLKYQEKIKPNITPPNNNLKKLINKKITIGQTNKGKMLVGKIVNVIKKADKIISNSKSNNSILFKNNQTNKVSTPIQILQEIPKSPAKEVVDKRNNLIENTTNNMSPTNSTITNILSDLPPLIRIPSGKTKEDKLKAITNENTGLPQNSSTCLVRANLGLGKTIKSAQDKDLVETPRTTSKVGTLENSPKLIFHEKVVTKDCFDVISRTLTGLMNMDSVVKQLKNSTIIIKIIQKTYQQDTGNYSKSFSYCSGYMVREFKLDDQDSGFSESWKFIPDANSKETILGQDNLESFIPDGQKSSKRFANLTFQITVNPEGNRTTRVIINPPALFQCTSCSKRFRNSALLKLHSLDCHAPPGLECTECFLKFKTIAEAKEHSSARHSSENNKGMYECMECNQCFQTPLQIRKHMDMHYKPECNICKLSFSSAKELNKHSLAHFEHRLPELYPIGSVEQEDENIKPSERKVYSCHICDRQFSRHSNLQRHIEIHQGEGAMYQCAVCSCSYHYISSLTRHVVSCHMDKSQKNANSSQETGPLTNQDEVVQVLQDDEIVQMGPLEHMPHMSEESIQQYVREHMGYVNQDFQENEDGVEILQIAEDSINVLDD